MEENKVAMSLDILLYNARIVDGTGAPWYRGSVGIKDGTIETVTRESDPGLDASTSVDVDDAVICPGFIDAHSHSDLKLFSDPTLEPKIRQGVTTEILGQDGLSMAPMYRDGGAEEWESYLSGLAGTIERDWSWGSTEDYLDSIDENGVACNMAFLVGHGTVRYNVMGMSEREPNSNELEEMADLITESLEQGAIGFSTGLVYTPQVYADTYEVQQLASRLAPYGRPFVAHIRSEGRWIWEAMDEFYDIGAEEGIPVHHSHFKVSGSQQWGESDRAITLVDTARERGINVTADQYPYPAGSTPLPGYLPPWVLSAEPDQMKEYLRSEEGRKRIRKDIEKWRIEGWENIAGKVGWENIHVASVKTEKNKHLEGETFADIAADRDDHPVDVMCDLLIEEDQQVNTVEFSMTEADVKDIMANRNVCVGTDGLFGGRPHPRVFGTFPRILGKYVREENLMSIEEAVRKMTSLTASEMGLQQKGVIKPQMDADITVFDPNLVESPATFDRPRQYPNGIPYVIVNGEFAVRDGEVTGDLPGRTLRA
jgi:N-acyl-D-amino-acid deacylase